MFLFASARTGKDGTRQIPSVVLSTQLSPYGALSRVGVHGLLHEFGHALHAILYTGDRQIMSGVRVIQEFVEVPSTLSERFLDRDEFISLLDISVRISFVPRLRICLG